MLDENGDPELEQVYTVDTGTVPTINTADKKLYGGDQELIDITGSDAAESGVQQAGGSYAVVFGKKLQSSLPRRLRN